MVVTTDPCSIPRLASSAAGLTMAGSEKSAGPGAPVVTYHSGTGRPCAARTALRSGFRWQIVEVHDEHPVTGMPASSIAAPTLYSKWLTPPMPSHRLKTTSDRRTASSHPRSSAMGTVATSCPSPANTSATARTGARTARMSFADQSSAPPS